MLFWSLVCHIELSKVCHNLLWFFKLWSPKVLGLTYKLFTSFLLDTIAFFNWIPLFMKSRPATDVKHLLITYSKKFFTFNLPLQNVLAFQISSSFYHNIFFLIFSSNPYKICRQILTFSYLPRFNLGCLTKLLHLS